nr:MULTISPECIES: thiol reductant ABC exporter subunit CydD [unclassified Leucobacter]
MLRTASSARSVFGWGALIGLIRTLAIIAWSWFLAQSIAAAAFPVLRFTKGSDLSLTPQGTAPVEQLPFLLGCALVALLLRAGSSWAMDALAARGSVRVKAELRSAALDAIDARSPQATAGVPDSRLATTLGRGLDALDGYFAGYVPQLILAVVATPVMIACVFLADPLSGIIVVIVFPVIPVFMVLIGLATKAVQDRQWSRLQHLSASFLDVVTGLATLKIFRREERQAARIARETDEYRESTMKVLRVTFLSGFVLDLAGTFSIALVAVTVGTRLVVGDFPLAMGLFVLLLLPEVFIPIRQVGAAFHASAEGLTAVGDVFDLIDGKELGGAAEAGADADADADADTDAAAKPDTTAGDVAVTDGLIGLADVPLVRGSRQLAPPLKLSAAPGEVVALAGPSGVGKSTAIALLMGTLEPTEGTVYRPAHLSWVGQRPGLIQGTVGENLALGGTPDVALARRALNTVGLEDLELDYELGSLGSGLSGGQSQRVSVARALFRTWQLDAPAVVLDEPTSALDADSERLVIRAMRDEADAGRAVLVVSHRPAVLNAADRVERIEAAEVQA